MKIKIHKTIKSKKGLLVVPVFKETLKKLPKTCPKVIKNFIQQTYKSKDFQTKKGSAVSTYIGRKELPEKVLAISFGSSKKYNVRSAKELGGKIGKHAKGVKAQELTMLMSPETQEYAQELLEGLLMSQYEVDKLKSKKEKNKYELVKLDVVTEEKDKKLKKSLERAQLINEGVEYVKDLVNTPSNVIDSDYFAKDNVNLSKKYNLDLKKYGYKSK